MSKVILVTGTSTNAGIGFELTRLLAENGHIVYLGARDEVSGQQAVESLRKQGLTTVKFIPLDLTNLPSITAAKETIEAADGHLDVLVNNASIAKFSGTDESATTNALGAMRDAMETNVYSLIQTTDTFLPLLRGSTNAVIVNVSTDTASDAYQAPSSAQPHVVAYNMSKAALHAYSSALAEELKEDGIKVNVVTTGFTSTKTKSRGAKAGAEAILPWALLDKNGPTGLFVD